MSSSAPISLSACLSCTVGIRLLRTSLPSPSLHSASSWTFHSLLPKLPQGLPGPRPKLMRLPSQRCVLPNREPRWPGSCWALCWLRCPLRVAQGIATLLWTTGACPAVLSPAARGQARPTQKHLTLWFLEAPMGPAPALSPVFICPPLPVRQVTRVPIRVMGRGQRHSCPLSHPAALPCPDD